MKKTILIALLSWLMGTSLNAQYNWCVLHNGKERLHRVSEQPEKNQLTISTASLKKSGHFQIKFNKADTSMRRTLLVDDASGSGIGSWEEVKRSWRISNKELTKLFAGQTQLKFYFTEIPRDVNQAMLVRVRPVHLCTLNRK
ncbi:MAG: hypothetical protein ACKO6Q_02535 [Bacteroidota bacterium]